MSERIGTMRFTLEIGLLSRSVLTDIRQICWAHNMDVKIESLDSGWLSRTYGIEVKGPESKLKALDSTVKKAVTEWNTPNK